MWLLSSTQILGCKKYQKINNIFWNLWAVHWLFVVLECNHCNLTGQHQNQRSCSTWSVQKILAQVEGRMIVKLAATFGKLKIKINKEKNSFRSRLWEITKWCWVHKICLRHRVPHEMRNKASNKFLRFRKTSGLLPGKQRYSKSATVLKNNTGIKHTNVLQRMPKSENSPFQVSASPNKERGDWQFDRCIMLSHRQKSVGIFLPSFMILFMHVYAKKNDVCLLLLFSTGLWHAMTNPFLEQPKVAMMHPNIYLINSIQLIALKGYKPLGLQVIEKNSESARSIVVSPQKKSKGRHNDQNKFEWEWCNSFDRIEKEREKLLSFSPWKTTIPWVFPPPSSSGKWRFMVISY